MTPRARRCWRRLDGPAPTKPPGRRPSRAIRNEAGWMSADILRVLEIAARLRVRLLATFTPAVAELMHDALVRLAPVLRALEDAIGTATGQSGPCP